MKSKPKAKIIHWLEPKKPSGPDPLTVDYEDSWGITWNRDGIRACGMSSIPILEFLIGRKYDSVVLAYVSAFRPSVIRVTLGMVKLDWHANRVTIDVVKKGRSFFVTAIHMEVAMALPSAISHSDALRLALDRGIDSPEVKWHLNAESYHVGLRGYFKYVDGKAVRWKFKNSRKKNPKIWMTNMTNL